MQDQPEGTTRRVVLALLAVVCLAAAIGLVIALVTTVAVRSSGVLPDPSDAGAPTSGDSGAAAEDPGPTTQDPSAPATPDRSSPAPSATRSPSSSAATQRPPRPEPAIELIASTGNAGSFERVRLGGSYPNGDGSELQVQRMEGGRWVEFPVTASVSSGNFETFVELGVPGPNRLRVVDPATGRSSNAVVIRIS